jgi:predicted dinucleotide-binding enzyme
MAARQRGAASIAENTQDAKAVAAQLMGDAGLEPVDAGPLRTARHLEPFTLAIVQLACESGGEPEIAYRIVQFREKHHAWESR